MPAAPDCPNCGKALDNVLDLPYGYWTWTDDGYQLRSPSARVDVSPWTCAACLAELRPFHPQDFGTASSARHPGASIGPR